MANEITVQARLTCKKGTYPPEFSKGVASRSFTQTGTNQSGGVQAIGFAAHEALNVADVGTAGWAWFLNTDTTNYVEIGFDTTGTFRVFLKLFPGEFAICPLGTSAPYAQANTASVDLEYGILER